MIERSGLNAIFGRIERDLDTIEPPHDVEAGLRRLEGWMDMADIDVEDDEGLADPLNGSLDPAEPGSIRYKSLGRTRLGDFFARLAGAHPDVLAKAPTERVKYVAMGGVILSTAAIAGVSAAFALNTAVGLTPLLAVVAGMLWAVVICNLDRMLVVTMTRQTGWWRNLLIALPRVTIAVLLGTVISVPLVLRIFEVEIESELAVLQAEDIAAVSPALDRAFPEIDPLRAQIARLQSVASGASQPSVTSDPDVVAAQALVQQAQDSYDKATTALSCELDGSCGSGSPGVGLRYRELKSAADQSKAALDSAQGRLNTALESAQNRISASSAAERATAQQQLPALNSRLDQLTAERDAQQRELVSRAQANDGLLARVEALSRLSADNPPAASASWLLMLLFLTIEVLPVMTKLLSMSGEATLYERLLDVKEYDVRERSSQQEDVALQIRRHLAEEQIRLATEANSLLVAKQAEIAKKAIDVWAQIAMEKSDEELIKWVESVQSSFNQADAPGPLHGLPRLSA